MNFPNVSYVQMNFSVRKVGLLGVPRVPAVLVQVKKTFAFIGPSTTRKSNTRVDIRSVDELAFM